MEEWKFIKHDGSVNFNYQVSNFGRVKSLLSGKELIMKTRINSWGYEIVNVKTKDGMKTKQVHRLVAEAFIEWRDSKWQVNHKDANKLNNRVDNLEYVTSKENMIHARKQGLLNKDRPKLSERESQAIYYLAIDADVEYLTIANAFDISRRTVFNVIDKQKDSLPPASK